MSDFVYRLSVFFFSGRRGVSSVAVFCRRWPDRMFVCVSLVLFSAAKPATSRKNKRRYYCTTAREEREKNKTIVPEWAFA